MNGFTTTTRAPSPNSGTGGRSHERREWEDPDGLECGGRAGRLAARAPESGALGTDDRDVFGRGCGRHAGPRAALPGSRGRCSRSRQRATVDAPPSARTPTAVSAPVARGDDSTRPSQGRVDAHRAASTSTVTTWARDSGTRSVRKGVGTDKHEDEQVEKAGMRGAGWRPMLPSMVQSSSR
jgi:hypothetical protein